MTSTEPVWMTREAYTRLQTELAALRSRPTTEVAEDSRDNDQPLVTKFAARQARIRQIQDLLTNAVVGEDPPDDGIAEPGMVLTVRYDDTGEIETFLLGVRGVEDADVDVYSMQSPLGSAIAGARSGEQRTYSIPSGGQPARDAPHGGALRYARPPGSDSVTVRPAARQRPLGERRPLRGTAGARPGYIDTPCRRPIRHLKGVGALSNDLVVTGTERRMAAVPTKWAARPSRSNTPPCRGASESSSTATPFVTTRS